ncbi:DNA-methyltransferase [Arcobacter caeni]|nr:site-specific DNA-methyltransferase [Arcobacter caeni]
MVAPLHVQNELKYGLEINKVYNEDCMIGMEKIKDKSIDMILCDLPYGTTACKWDIIIPLNDYIEIEIKNKIVSMNENEYKLYCFENNIPIEIFKIKWKEQSKKGLWTHYKRIIKDDGAIVLTAKQPFTSELIDSNIKDFKQELIWLKTRPSNFMNAKKMFMSWHENVLIFYKKLPTFNRQMVNGKKRTDKINKVDRSESVFGSTGEKHGYEFDNNGLKNPNTILEFSNPNSNSLHPTQKPIELFEYLIKTYTNENDMILDNCMGSGTTAIASLNLNRKFIGFETNKRYIEIINTRIEERINLNANQ